MGEEINWDGFQYPLGCKLSEDAQKALIKRKCDPFIQCWHNHSGACLDAVREKCCREVLRVESQRPTSG